jgi:hypothetical protein
MVGAASTCEGMPSGSPRADSFGALTRPRLGAGEQYRALRRAPVLDSPSRAGVTLGKLMVRARPGRLSALSASHSKSVLYGAFVMGAHGA